MHSPALAIAWEFRRRHRWGLLAVAGYLIAVATYRLLVLEPGQRVDFADAQSFAFVVLVPMTATFVYFLAVFTFGLSGDLAARQSMYPARLFTLPVTTAALVGWPMLFGALAMALLWLATRLFALWPDGAHVPVIWPGLMAAALLAWTQALTWMPYGLPGLRVVVALLWLVAIDTVALLAIAFKAPESVMLAILAPQIPLAYAAARVALARARRGDVPDWRPGPARLGISSDLQPRRRKPFRSAERAQAWLEWRRHGRSLPVWVGILLPFELVLLFAAGTTTSLVFVILLVVLLTPPFMAAFAASAVSASGPRAADANGVTPFIATRPMSSAALITAKLTMAIWSTLAAWLLVFIAIPVALSLSGTWPMVIERTTRFAAYVGAPRAIIVTLLVLGGLVAATWRQLVQSLCIGLTGRAWFIRTNALLPLSFLVAIGPLALWLHDSTRGAAAAWDALPGILAALVLVKMFASACFATQLYRGRLLSDRTLVTGAAGWLAAVSALYALLIWLLATPLTPRYLFVLVAILAIPLARVSAAPLALAWNRHR